MSNKKDNEVLERCLDDEPIFVLRAQDLLAPMLVRLWVMLARLHGCRIEKTSEALRCAEEMEKWPARKWPD